MVYFAASGWINLHTQCTVKYKVQEVQTYSLNKLLNKGLYIIVYSKVLDNFENLRVNSFNRTSFIIWSRTDILSDETVHVIW